MPCGPRLRLMVSEPLNQRRNRLIRMEANAGRKIARNRREKGVELEGSSLDPRRGTEKIGKYNSRQLDALERRLTEFNSRRTQFEAGVRGAPLPRAAWLKYKESETRVREKFNAELKPIKDVRLPGPGDETVGIRQDKMRTKHPTALNMAYVPPERKPFNVKDLDSLNKLTKANKKRMTAKWNREEHKRAQKELQQMVEVFEDAELSKMVEGMSKGQFNVLWNFTKFADNMSITYHHYQKKYTPKQKMPQELVDNELAQAKTLIQWVKGMKI